MEFIDLTGKGGNKFKRRGPIQKFSVDALQTDIPQAFY